MPITLDEAKKNAPTPLDVQVIDEYRKTGVIPDTLIYDDIVSAAGGGVLAHGYRRLVTQATAATREINKEYTDQNVTTELKYSQLAVMGGSFSIDRVTAELGPSASGGIALNMTQKIKATNAKFADLVVNGDVATDANSFDGLDKALVGTSTEYGTGAVTDWTDFDTNPRAEHKALDAIDEFLSLLDGAPTIILGNKFSLARVRAAARRAGMYTKDPVEGLIGANGRPIEREMYGGIVFGDAGAKAGSNDEIIPVAADGTTSLYAYRVGLDGFCGVSTIGGSIAKAWLPKFDTAGAVKRGEVELGPVGVELRATKAAAVFRQIKVR
ncbi:major capsid protein [Microbacterium sp. GXS0129]|uniref:major capsid protein n=1 Tax=Microbacterium sp. GXS0129 TaxID=3377836 RepID=UPI00383B437E